jgi:ABC-type lipoprotein export system ATPase subunit
VALARALAGGADLLLVDEPTAELDEANRDRAFALLRTAADRGTAVVVATHDPAVVACCDRMLRLSDGRVPAPGGDGPCAPRAAPPYRCRTDDQARDGKGYLRNSSL